MDQFLNQLINGLSLGALYALIAVGYTVVYGIVQLINFAHGEVFMIGGFGALSVWLMLFDSTNTTLWALPLMLLGAMAASVGVAVVMERFAYRPLRNAPRLAPLITAIGVSVFLQEFVRLFYNRPWWTLPVMAVCAPLVAYWAANYVARRTGTAGQVGKRTVLATVGIVLVVEAIVRLLYRDTFWATSVGLVVVGLLVGLAVSSVGRSPADSAGAGGGGRLQLLGAGAGAALLLEAGWWVYEDYLRTAGFPIAKAKIAFPQIDGVTGSPISLSDNVTISRPTIFTFVALAICAVFLWYFVNRTRLGRAMQATSQDPDTARLMGINVDRIIVIAFMIGAALAAIAGIAHGLRNTNIDFRMGFTAGLKAFTAAVLGGIGNIQGAVLGGLVLGVAESLVTEYIPGQFGGSSWKDIWAFVILILVLVFRPQGLLGARVVDRA